MLGIEVATKMSGDVYYLMRDTTYKQTIATGIKVKKYGMNRRNGKTTLQISAFPYGYD